MWGIAFGSVRCVLCRLSNMMLFVRERIGMVLGKQVNQATNKPISRTSYLSSFHVMRPERTAYSSFSSLIRLFVCAGAGEVENICALLAWALSVMDLS